MPKRVKKPSSTRLPEDVNQRMRRIVELTTQGPSEFKEQLSEYMKKLGRKGGRKSGRTRTQWLSKEDRVRIASDAAKARWAKEARKKKDEG